VFWNQNKLYWYSQGIVWYANLTDNDLRVTPLSFIIWCPVAGGRKWLDAI
jgi:hypothetical protein